jgi:dihydroorotate dehydrogenase (NAD+) catalytic subunit
MKIDLSVKIAGIKLKNPVLTASGTFGYGDEITDLVDVSKLGGIITKTITLKPKAGNPSPRICETAEGMLNCIGLQNIGVERFLKEKSAGLKKIGTVVIVSVAGETAQDYVDVVKQLNSQKWIRAVELNLSCPNLQKHIISKNSALVAKIVSAVKRIANFPVIAKLSPQVTDLAAIAKAAKTAGADAVCLVNTFPGMAVDLKTWRPKLSNVSGGLSGPCIKPLALLCVREVFNKVGIPIIGCGGIVTGEDVAEFMLCGARAVCVGTASFIEPERPVKVIAEIENYLKMKKIGSIGSLIGGLRV